MNYPALDILSVDDDDGGDGDVDDDDDDVDDDVLLCVNLPVIIYFPLTGYSD